MIDQGVALARAKRAYELGRARHAATLALPVGALSVAAACLGSRPQTSALVGLALLAVTWLLLWRGQTLGRSVFPGVVAGLVPLVLALGARSYGHVCTGSECVSLCIPACTIGGAVAGFVIARAGRNATSRPLFIVGAGTLAVLVGSLGCSCVGYGGVAGLNVGLIAMLLPTLALRVRA